MRLLIVLLSLLAVGCDPTWATVVENTGDQAAIIRVETLSSADGRAYLTVYELQPGDRIQVGSRGVGSDGDVKLILVMDSDCKVIHSVATDAFSEGGVLTIGEGGAISVATGGNPGADKLGTPTDRCPT